MAREEPIDLVVGPEPWTLSALGALVDPQAGLAVIADVHLGYEWARAAGGDMVPPHSLVETRERLERLLAVCRITTLIVAGDLVESSRPCPRTARDVRALREWLTENHIELILVRGNHDVRVGSGVRTEARWTHHDWVITHGHRAIPNDVMAIYGHYHPALKVGSHTAPCFLVSGRSISLPAFSGNAAGLDLATAPLPPGLVRDHESEMSCIATTGREVLDFGPLERLRDALAPPFRTRARRRRPGTSISPRDADPRRLGSAPSTADAARPPSHPGSDS